MSLARSGKVVDLSPTLLQETGGPSSLLWLVNICRPSCGFCQGLEPRWQLLAKQLRHEVVVAHWDAAAYPELPSMVGAANATPTIRALQPTDDGIRNIDYRGAHVFEHLQHFAELMMPTFVAVVDSEDAWSRMARRANEEHLPVLLFVLRRGLNATTPRLLKALSSMWRNRLLITEVRLHASVVGSAALVESLGVDRTPSILFMRDVRAPYRTVHYDGWPTIPGLNSFADEMMTDALQSTNSSVTEASVENALSSTAQRPGTFQDEL